MAEPARPVGVPGFVVFAGGAVAVGDLGLENLADVCLGQAAPLDLAGTQASYRTGDMRAATSGGGVRAGGFGVVDGFGVADRAQRRAQDGHRGGVPGLHGRPEGQMQPGREVVTGRVR
jgi:hypothetical protein